MLAVRSADGQHRTEAAPHDGLCHAAHESVQSTDAAVRSHHDEIELARPGDVEDLANWIAGVGPATQTFPEPAPGRVDSLVHGAFGLLPSARRRGGRGADFEPVG